MKKILRLVSVQLWALLGDMLSIGDIRKKKPRALYIGILLFILTMGTIAFFYCYMIGKALLLYKSIQILPPMVMAVTSMVVLMTTIFKVKGTIFGFRDYDMVMSLPVSTGGIVASRVFLLYSINMLFVFILMVPMMIAYGLLASPGLLFYIYGGVAILFIPMFPIVLASVLGTLVTYLASRFRHSNILTIIISLIVFVAIIGLSFITGDSGEELVNISKAMMDQVNAMYPLAGLYNSAVCETNVTALGLFLVVSLVAFIAYSYIIGKIFTKMNSIIMAGISRRDYKLGELRTQSPLKALYLKEMKRYFASPIYVLNTGFGVVLLTLGTIAAIFVNPEKIFMNQIPVQFYDTLPMMITFCVIMSCTTMASISLEGKSLWIIKSLPVSTKIIFYSKLLWNLTIIAPAVLDAVLLSFLLELNMMKGLFTVLVTIVCALFTSLLGLLVNLWLPNLNWTTETMVVKQSAASLAAIFIGMVVVGIQFLALVLLPSFELAYLIYTLALAIVNIILYRAVMTYGVMRFRRL